jgi:hypothetical protein
MPPRATRCIEHAPGRDLLKETADVRLFHFDRGITRFVIRRRPGAIALVKGHFRCGTLFAKWRLVKPLYDAGEAFR